MIETHDMGSLARPLENDELVRWHHASLTSHMGHLRPQPAKPDSEEPGPAAELRQSGRATRAKGRSLADGGFKAPMAIPRARRRSPLLEVTGSSGHKRCPDFECDS